MGEAGIGEKKKRMEKCTRKGWKGILGAAGERKGKDVKRQKRETETREGNGKKAWKRREREGGRSGK